MKKRRIGIYGGSFSPPHFGHTKLAEAFIGFSELDLLYVVPAGTPPHKKLDGDVSGDVRLDMCRAAFLPVSDRIFVSDFEAYRIDPCYTVDTLKHFSAEGELFMLCGSDMFLSLDRWRDPEGIFALATVVCGARTDDSETVDALISAAEKYRENFGARCSVMDFGPVEISSTEIREKLGRGEAPAEIGTDVLRIISDHGLYGYGGGTE